MSQNKLATSGAMTTEALDKVNQAIEKTLTECSVEAVANLPAMKKAIALANGVTAMRNALTDQVMTQVFMPLQGSKMGFRTDQDREGGYPIEIVRECIIEAMMRGFMPVQNEFNIIGGNFYATKEGFMRKCPQVDGVTDIVHQPGVPHMNDSGAVVPYVLLWNYKGKPMKIERLFRQKKNEKGEVIETFDERIAVRVNKGQGPDAVLGKAKRKILAQMYDLLTGSTLSDGDPPDLDAITTTGESVPETPPKPANEKAVEELVNKHKKNGTKSEAVQESRPNTDPAADSSGHPAPGADG